MVDEVIALPPGTVKTLYESNADTNAFTDAEQAKLAGIEAGATQDQSGAEIVAAINSELGNTDWQTPGGGGSSMTLYTFDSGGDVEAFIYASGAGVTFAKDTNTGEHEFTIPDGVVVAGGGFNTPASFADPSNDLYLKLTYGGTRSFNNDRFDAIRPSVEIHNGQAAPSRGNPSFKSNTTQTAITSIGGGDIEVLIDDAGTLFPDLLVLFFLPL